MTGTTQPTPSDARGAGGFELNKPYLTRTGRTAFVTNAPDDNGRWSGHVEGEPCLWSADGRCGSRGGDDDLVNTPAPDAPGASEARDAGGFDHDGPASFVFAYTNHRGERAIRRVWPASVRFGSTEWHPEPQWLMRGFDIDKMAEREFAMRDMAPVPAVPGAGEAGDDDDCPKGDPDCLGRNGDCHDACLSAAEREAEDDAAIKALRQFIYETTCLSPEEDDGSHKCKISKKCLQSARDALARCAIAAPADDGWLPIESVPLGKWVLLDYGPTFASHTGYLQSNGVWVHPQTRSPVAWRPLPPPSGRPAAPKQAKPCPPPVEGVSEAEVEAVLTGWKAAGGDYGRGIGGMHQARQVARDILEAAAKVRAASATPRQDEIVRLTKERDQYRELSVAHFLGKTQVERELKALQDTHAPTLATSTAPGLEGAIAALEAWEAWEADIVMNGNWSGETVRLRQYQHDALSGVQQKRNAALRTLRTAGSSSTAPELTQAATDVLAERRRQVEVEGWTSEHDDGHDDSEIALAAACYARRAMHGEDGDGVPSVWPWDPEWWKPASQRQMLVKAGALILAEIDRLDREDALRAAAKDDGGAR